MLLSMNGLSYPEDGNSLCFAIEDESFWFRHRNDCILEAVKRFPPQGTIVDVGGGNGFVAHALQQAGHGVVLVEPGEAGVDNALKRGVCQAVQGTLQTARFQPGTIPAIGLFDVLEHIENDEKFLWDAHRYLADRGRLYLTVPAFQWLWSSEDEAAGHYRRYSKASITHILKRVGFNVLYASYFFHFLPLPTWVMRVLPDKMGRTKEAPTVESARAEHSLGPLASQIVRPLMHWELALIRRGYRVPFGGSCLVVAGKH